MNNRVQLSYAISDPFDTGRSQDKELWNNAVTHVIIHSSNLADKSASESGMFSESRRCFQVWDDQDFPKRESNR
jgi:hypothetical protein